VTLDSLDPRAAGSIPELLRAAAATAPERTAVAVSGGPRVGYGELLVRSEALAGRLAALGVRRGDRLAVRAGDGLAFFDAYLAAARLGAACVPVATALAEPETVRLIADARPTLGLADAAGAESLRRAGLRVLVAGEPEYESALATHRAPAAPPPDPADTLLIIYTSGTTGRPKGVCLSQAAIAMNAAMTVRDQTFASHEVYLSSTPLYHASAALRVFTTLFGAGTHVVLPKFDAASWLRIVEAEGVTSTIAVPTQCQQILDHEGFGPERMSSLRLLVYGAGPSTRSLVLRMRREFPCGLYHGYGLTESCAVVTGFTPADHEALTGSEDRRLGSIGRPVPGVELALRRPDGSEATSGEVGEITVRTAKVMSGYWDDPVATEAAFVDGRLLTGDLATVDDEGYLTLVGRTKDVIISGGVNIYPAQVERVIAAHPEVSEVAVFGLPDPDWGEVPVAAIRAEPGSTLRAEDVAAIVADQLDRRSRPRRVHFVEDFPRTPTGKIRRQDLPAMLD
jgi:acyl-CoA synthetase (AMP-forming)/AMP-acid ligase II